MKKIWKLEKCLGIHEFDILKTVIGVTYSIDFDN